MLARIFREVGCLRIAALTLALIPVQPGPKTGQKRGCAAFASNEKFRRYF